MSTKEKGTSSFFFKTSSNENTARRTTIERCLFSLSHTQSQTIFQTKTLKHNNRGKETSTQTSTQEEKTSETEEGKDISHESARELGDGSGSYVTRGVGRNDGNLQGITGCVGICTSSWTCTRYDYAYG